MIARNYIQLRCARVWSGVNNDMLERARMRGALHCLPWNKWFPTNDDSALATIATMLHICTYTHTHDEQVCPPRRSSLTFHFFSFLIFRLYFQCLQKSHKVGIRTQCYFSAMLWTNKTYFLKQKSKSKIQLFYYNNSPSGNSRTYNFRAPATSFTSLTSCSDNNWPF